MRSSASFPDSFLRVNPLPLSPSKLRKRRARHRRMALGLFMALLTPFQGLAGDILRGGAPAGQARNAASTIVSPATSAAADAARRNAADALARTTQAVQAIQQLQLQASNQFSGSNNLGANPNRPGQQLPDVANGLRPGGLDIIGTPTGADAPTEAVNNGHTTVTVKQQVQQAFLNWKTFNVGRDTTIHFDQSKGGASKGQWIAFNTVKDPTGAPSQIMGQIKADGQVYILNQNGIIFGRNSQVNTHTLVASALPVNNNLVDRGLLNNPDVQYLFSALSVAAGSKGTPAFTPELNSERKIGDVTVQAGAQITAPTNADKVGGRVALVGANVKNEGTISTPDGQTLMAAGLQVGMVAHSSNDPSLRGLDVCVGAVSDNTVGAYAGSSGAVNNTGLILAPRGNITLTGKNVRNAGAITATTSVAFNGRIDLNASYGAISNPAYDPTNAAFGAPFLYSASGNLTHAAGSVLQVLPELESQEKIVGTKLALPSQINMTAETIHFQNGAMVLAPNANISINAGLWDLIPGPGLPRSNFVLSGGQVYMDSGSWINVAGTAGVIAQMSENIITLQLRGSEFADFSYNRNGDLRGVDITLDIRSQGNYNGFQWAGTPLADARGFVGLVERRVDQLTTAGGTVKINSGGSVILQNGSQIDVSGGFIDYQGGLVTTTRVTYGSQLIDIADATPDRVYDGIYTGTYTTGSSKWGVSKTFASSLITGTRYEAGYTYGAAGGSLTINAPRMALDGQLLGQTVNGARQREVQAPASTLNLAFQAQQMQAPLYPTYAPAPPSIIFQNGVQQPAAAPFSLDANGRPQALRAERVATVILAPTALAESGFGHISVRNVGGDITVAAGETVRLQPRGSLSLSGANVTVNGAIIAPGGSINIEAFNIPPNIAEELKQSPNPVTPAPYANRGVLTLGANAVLNTAGLLLDERLGPDSLAAPIVMQGGQVTLQAFTANLATGSRIDVSGGTLIDWLGGVSYGDAGGITINAGRDLSLGWVTGGSLQLGASMIGMAGGGHRGGSLAIEAPRIQIGGATADADVLLLQPDFFNTGGFASFNLTAVGKATGLEQYAPGLVIAPGAIIRPVIQNFIHDSGGPGSGGAAPAVVTLPEGLRSSASLHFEAHGVSDDFTRLLTIRGDLVMGQGCEIHAGPLGAVDLVGDTVTVLGSVYAPGGQIKVKGADKLPSLDPNPPDAQNTVYLGPSARLSAAGALVLTPDPFGRRTGFVLPGGSISVSGNIVAELGSVLDVSGASGVLDVNPPLLGLTSARASLSGSAGVPPTSGLTTVVNGIAGVRTVVETGGGLIELDGGQALFTRATLLGEAGGATATGGSLSVNSGRFYIPGILARPDDVNLQITQSHANSTFFTPGQPAVGQIIAGSPGMGYFAVDSFHAGGFDNLQLGGNVNFNGPVTVNARGSLVAGSGGVIRAAGEVTLNASYAALGTPFAPPMLPTELQNPFFLEGQPYFFPPTFGAGTLTVNADLIDVGDLSLQNIGSATLSAQNGDVRGNGTFHMIGDLTIRAAQIYPVTGVDFTIAVYDRPGVQGSVAFDKAGSGPLPLSAGGTLNVFASNITQNGVLRAPFGVINLGWDGTGAAPRDLIAGSTIALPSAKNITLGVGSLTSVSAIDPVTGKGALIPYGTSPNGTSWIDPSGVDITSSGLPVKAVNLSGSSITSMTGAVVDLRGGGDLYAYRFVSGNNGTRDLLASNQSFAVLPGYASFFAPYGAFNTNTAAANLNGDRGYVNPGLKVGDRVYLGGGDGLDAGMYTLLPARYALLPGAFLVTPQEGIPAGNLIQPDGASLVNGYRYNSLNPIRSVAELHSKFEIASAATIARRAQYDTLFANTFLTKYAADRNQAVQRLPGDSGQLLFAATSGMALQGSVLSKPIGTGRDGFIDISSPVDIVIAYAGAPAVPGSMVLDAAQLSAFGAGSLLIGGVRSAGPNGTMVTVKTNNVTVANRDPGTGQTSDLSGSEIILAANRRISVEAGASIKQSGALSGSADKLLIGSASTNGSGDGSLLRVSSDVNAQMERSGVSSTGTLANMVIAAGASISGNSVTLDSTVATSLSTAAVVNGQALNLHSGQVSLQLNNPGALQTTRGLVLSSSALGALSSASSLSLLSYSSIDIYGTGTVGATTLQSLALRGGEIRGFNTGGGTATLQARNVIIDNGGNGRVIGPVGGTLSGALALDAETVRIGANSSRMAQYATLSVNASKGVFLQGTGGLSAAGAITVDAPFISAALGSSQSIVAGGALTISSGGSTTAAVAGGLGASVLLQGATVFADTNIVLPSGALTLSATTGNLTVGGRLDVAGSARTIHDQTRYAGGGSITLVSANGNVVVNGAIDVGAHAGGGAAGSLTVHAAKGAFTLGGALEGRGGASFALDTASLSSTSALSTTLNNAGFTGARSFRVRTGNVTVGGVSNSRSFLLSADAGRIDVTGTVDVSGNTGGAIHLVAAQGVAVKSGAILNASATAYDNAGKGGAVTLETRGQSSGQISIESGATIDLRVAASARLGQFTGTLHMRAPQNDAATNLAVAPVQGTILGASSITAEGFRVYDLTGSGAISTTVQNQIMSNGVTFGASHTAFANALFTGANASLKDVFSVQVGAEVINRTGDLTLGAASPGGGSAAWNLAGFRFGTKQAPGVLTLRAAGNLVFNEALSDGFATGAYNSLLLANNALLPDHAEAWSYRLAAGADFNAVDFRQTVSGTGSLLLGRNAGVGNELANNLGQNARTALAVAGFYQVIRTGSGSIDIAAGRDVQLLNQFATIYTAGTLVTDATLGGAFDVPIVDFAGGVPNLGAIQQAPAYAVQYTSGGGNVTIAAGNDITHLTRNAANQLIADSQRQLPSNWLYRRGYVDPATGAFGTARFGDTASTTWWVDFSNFFQGVGALGGGNVTLTAGRDIANVDAVVPTNARMPRNGRNASDLVELGGGDLSLRTGRNLDAGMYYVERGKGMIHVGGSIITNATRSPSITNLAGVAPLAPETWLPTTFMAGKAAFNVNARGNALLGPVSNPFLLPGGYNNSFWYKSYFSTYSQDAGVEAVSLSGDVTLRQSATLPTVGLGGAMPVLQAWIQNELVFNAQNPNTAAFYHPWLRLNETKVDSFGTTAALMPGTLKLTAFNGDINLAGNVTLSPAPRGTLDLLASGAVNALQIMGQTTINGIATKAWGTSRVNVSDAPLTAVPGVTSPFAFQVIAGTQVNLASQSGDNFLAFVDNAFRESGSTSGTYGVLQTKQALHAAGILHAGDTQPVRIYAGSGDITGLTLFSPKAARVISGRDIRDIAFYIQNTSKADVSVITSGRDMILYDANSTLRTQASALGNALNFGESPLAGDIQISGPGTIQILAGRHLDLGIGANNVDGTGVGITSIGNGRNPSLPFEGANVIVGAGIGLSRGLADSALGFTAFINHFIKGAEGSRYLTDYSKASGSTVDTLAEFDALPLEEQKRLALEIFYIVLRNAGRDHIATGDGYTAGFDAIKALFPSETARGDILTQARDIRTKSGGSISLFTPGGGVQLATAVIGQPLAPPGIITEGGGSISIFADRNVDIGIARIFTLRGGDEIIWSSKGDIAAGSSSKTVQSAPPTRVVIDPQSGDVKTDLAGLATGGGIGVLATVAGIPPGSVDLIAPNGTVDAGDAGIRATGNLTIAAVVVLNANNISVGGVGSGGAAAPAVAAPNIGGLGAAANATAATANAAGPKAAERTQPAQELASENVPSIMSVEVLGYGGGEGTDAEEEEKKKRRGGGT
jgi:filamentous hemagglutinin family protein